MERLLGLLAGFLAVLVLGMGLIAAHPADVTDLAYGPHSRNRLDLWLAPSDRATPLVVLIHGGGFSSGDKSAYAAQEEDAIATFLRAGVSVAVINYRLTEGGLHPYPAPMLDGARAIQFLRHHAPTYNLDPDRFGAMGSSAGGCMLLWIGFHEDLAQSESEDPIARASTRLQALAPSDAQSSLHLPALEAWFGVTELVEHPAFRPLFGLPSSGELVWTDDLLNLSLDASPITHLSVDDPPVFATYTLPDIPVTSTTHPNIWVHHPIFGIELKAAMDEMGLPCHLRYPGSIGDEEPIDAESFLIGVLTGTPQSP